MDSIYPGNPGGQQQTRQSSTCSSMRLWTQASLTKNAAPPARNPASACVSRSPLPYRLSLSGATVESSKAKRHG